MYYWNQDNFEGMAALADELSREPAFAAFADPGASTAARAAC